MGRPVAVVTGAARGIGFETARRLSATHRLALLDVDGEGVTRAAAELDGALGLTCDVTDADAVGAAIARVVQEHGGIDVCIANAGVGAARVLRRLPAEELEAVLAVNLVGAWRTIHACLPHVIERRGYVLGVASAAALLAPPGLGAYAASKAGLAQLLEVLRSEVAHLGVDVGIAYFLWIDTEMVRGAQREHPGFAELRRDLPGRAGRVLPVGVAADALAHGVQERSARIVAPRSLGAVYRLRGLLGELFDRQARKAGPALDRLSP